MKKKSLRMVAAAIAAVILLCSAVAAFAYDTEIPDGDVGTAPEVSASASDTTLADKSEYYSRNADMNEDWMLNSADARSVLRLVAKLDWVKDPSWLPKGVVFGDIDENGKLTSSDARSILLVSAKLATVPQIVAAEATRPTLPPKTDPTASETQKPAASTTAKPEVTTNPNEVVSPFCGEFAITAATSSGVKYTVATNGFDCYVFSEDVLSDIGVYIDRNGDIYLVDPVAKEYAPFKADTAAKLGIGVKKLRDFAASFEVPNPEDAEGYKISTETIDLLSYTVAEKNSIKFYFYGDNSLFKISAKTFAGKSADFTAEKYEEAADEYLSILGDYKKISTNMFIIKHGISLLF